MKRIIIICISMLFVLTACAKNKDATPPEQLSDDYIAQATQVIVPLDHLPDDYSIEDAKKDNYVVYENGDITKGQPAWDTFVKAQNAGESATVRLAFYYTLGDPASYDEDYYSEIKDDYPALYVKDLTFTDGEGFVISGFEEEKLITHEYKYMLKYEGVPSSGSATFSQYTYYVLVNDEHITWADIEYGMFSSQSGDSIDHYRVYSDLVFNE